MTDTEKTIAELLGEVLEQAQYVCEKATLELRDIDELRKRGKRYHAALLTCGSATVTLTVLRMGQKAS